MGYYGFMGNVSSYGPMGGNWPTPGGPNAAAWGMGVDPTECYKDAYCGSSASKKQQETEKPHKTGISGFFEGLKNGLFHTVEALFTVKGLLMTAGTLALVVATGGAALIPLAMIGLGTGAYQIGKGVVNQNAEQVGEGVFTTGASLLGLKMAPSTVGSETLANPSLWGKLKAPFIGKGAFTNPEATFWSASKDSSLASMTRMKEGMMGASERFNESFRESYKTLKTRGKRENLKDLASGVAPNPSPPNQQGPSTPWTQRAHQYFDRVKNSPNTVGAYMGTVFSGPTKTDKPDSNESESRAPMPNYGMFYY
jgi:hypothetical protein